VYFRTHPNRSRVDRYCGAFDRSYVAEQVTIPEGEERVLTLALRSLFHDFWSVERSRVSDVNIVDGRAVIDFASWDDFGFASTSLWRCRLHGIGAPHRLPVRHR
jgi:hypothetical protein